MNNFKPFVNQDGVAFIPAALVSAFTAVASIISWLRIFITITLSGLAFKFAAITLAVSVYLGIFAAFVFGIFECIDIMKAASPSIPSEMKTAATWFVPGNVQQFISCIVGIAFLELVFKHKNRLINIISKAQ